MKCRPLPLQAQIVRGIDEPDMGKNLWKIAEQTLPPRIMFFC